MKSAAMEMTEDSMEFRPEEFSRYIASEAGHFSRLRPNDREDLIQEGFIAAWKASESFDAAKNTAFKSWVIRSIDYALLQAYSRRKWTGMPARNQLGGGSNSKEQALLIADWGVEDESGYTDVPKSLVVEDHSARADWIYHQVEILKAISRLSSDQQKYVVLRFWLGYKPREMAPFFTHLKSYETCLWYGDRGARAKLKEALSHLVSR